MLSGGHLARFTTPWPRDTGRQSARRSPMHGQFLGPSGPSRATPGHEPGLHLSAGRAHSEASQHPGGLLLGHGVAVGVCGPARRWTSVAGTARAAWAPSCLAGLAWAGVHPGGWAPPDPCQPQRSVIRLVFYCRAVCRMAPQFIVVTSTTARSSVAVSVKDARAASVVPSEAAAHDTTAVRAASSHGR
jgi:hypothetical protein